METPGGYSKAVQLNESELYFVIARFLEGGPCQQAAEVLKRELVSKQLLPRRKNWLGEDEELTYQDAVDRASHVTPGHLQLLCSKLLGLLEQHGYQKTAGLHSLLGAGTTANITNVGNENRGWLPSTALFTSLQRHELSVAFKAQPLINMCQLVSSRQLSPRFARNAFTGPQFYKGLKKHRVILGHLAPVFCVLFDHTGQCIITGADDNLVKVWSSRTGQLLATLRGHCAEVTDMSLSCDNTMIASGSLDKSVRVWCSHSTAPVAVLSGHQGHVTSVQFSPSPIEEYRYLASTGKDGHLCFWQWLPDSCTFNATAIKFMEKNRMGDQTLCSAFSPGGKFFVTGGTDRIIRVYMCIPGPPTLQAELKGHTDRIMTIQFGNTGGSMFATGSCDGTTRIWSYKEGGWVSIVLRVPRDEMNRMAAETAHTGKPDKPQVTMVGWEKTDSYLTTAFSPDCNIRVWKSDSGALLHTLKSHTGEIFVLEAHPTDPRILMSAGHDGLVILWDILAGEKLKTLQLEDEEGSVPCIFDCKFSPDGLMCAAVDSSGQLTLFGFGSSKPYQQHPREQFFHTDYRPLMQDRNHYVVEELTQLPPHLLPPPYLVNIDGHAHPLRYQEAILKHIRPVKQVKPEKTMEEIEDYDEYMQRHLATVKQQSFGFSRARSNMSANVQASSSQQESGPQADPLITQGPSAQILSPQERIGGHCGHESTMESATWRSGSADQPDPHIPSNDSLYLATEHNYAGVQVPADCCSSSGSQSRGSQFLSAVQHQRMVVAVVLDGKKEDTREAQTVEGVCRPRSESKQSDVEEDKSGGTCLQDPAPAEVPTMSEPVVANSSGSEQGGSTGGEGNSAGPLRCHPMEEAAINIPSSATGNTFRSPPPPPPPLSLSHPAGTDTNSNNRPAADDEEPVINVTDDDGTDVRNMLFSLVGSLGLGEAEQKQAISLWHNRVIVPSLDVATLSSEEARRRELYQKEERRWGEENSRIIHTLSPPPQPRKEMHGRALRSGRTLPDPLEERRMSLESDSLSESEGVESEVEEVWEQESTASSDISDWTTEAGLKLISPVRKRNKRLRKLHESVVSVSSEEGEIEGEEEGPGPSTQGERRRDVPSREKKKRRRSHVKVADYTAYWPPDWLKMTRPQVTPYFPQVGDIVIYCRQGHEIYMNTIREEKTYALKSQKMPWQKYNLLPQEFCQVKNVHYVVGPPTLCSITLTLLSPSATTSVSSSDGSGAGQRKITFTFKYHDMDGMLDFLVLDSVYKTSVRRQWQPDDRFCSLIDNAYWHGRVIKREPFSEDFPTSYWQCYHVLWDDGATDQLSPWDMEPIPQDEKDPAAMAMTLLRPTENVQEAWEGEGEVERILHGLDVVSELDEAFMFRQPVDLEEEPMYCVAVPFPTDLSTIRERLQNQFYRRKIALLWEVIQLGRNATAYNEEDSLIVKHARVLIHTLCKFILDPTCTDPLDCYEEEPEGDVETEVNVTVPEVEFMEDTLPPMTNSPIKTTAPSNRQDPEEDEEKEEEEEEEEEEDPSRVVPLWVEKAEKLLDVLEANDNSPPFLQPVDTNTYPDYLLVILHPMDLSTIRQNLLSGQYDCPSSFLSDIRLVFKNAKTYNRRGSAIYKMTTELQSFFEMQALDFLASFQDGVVIHRTRNTLGRLASSSGANNSEISMNATSPPVTRQQTRAAAGLKLVIEAGESSGEECRNSTSVDISAPATPSSEASSFDLTRRETRSMTLRRSSSDGFSMTLRSRETRKRVLEDSNSENESRDEEEVTTFQTCRPRRTTRGKQGRTPRKCQRVLTDSEPEDDNGTVQAVVTSRGRIVKLTSKLT